MIMEEKTISGKDVIKVLLGNKWLYLIMMAAFFAVAFVGFNMYSAGKKEYVSFFDYDVAGFKSVTNEDGEQNTFYIDGQKFDPRSLVTRDKINKYINYNTDLLSLNPDELYKRNTIKSFNYVTKYKENDHKMDDKDAAFIEDKKGYELILDTYSLNERQAKVLAEAIAYEVIEITKEKIDSLHFVNYINAFDEAKAYPDKIRNLIEGVNYLQDLSNSLDESYGNFQIDAGKYGGETDNYYIEGKTITDWRNQMNIKLENYFLNSLNDELNSNGYINPEGTDYIIALQTNVDNLEVDIGNNKKLRDELLDQRDALVGSVGTNATVESLEIREYNTKIIDLTTLITEQTEKQDVYKLQLANLDSTKQAATYSGNLANFETKLENIRNDLDFYSKQYESIAKKAMKDNMKVYFENADIVTLRGDLKLSVTLGGSLAIALIGPMIVNLAITGFNLAEGKPILKLKKEKDTPEE